MFTFPRTALCCAFLFLATTTAPAAPQSGEFASEGWSDGPGFGNGDVGGLPSNLPWIEFDFEDKDERGTFPYEITIEGIGEVKDPGDPLLTHSGTSGLVFQGDGRLILTFSVPVERLDFYWRDQTETVKSAVTGFDVNGEIAFRADGMPHAWGFVEYNSMAVPVMRLEFTMQTPQFLSVIDDLRIRHSETARNFCIGDGFSVPFGCPCGNLSQQHSFEGCTNSTTRGARMNAMGSVCTTSRDLRFYVAGLPAGQPALLVEGETTDHAIPFRDGLLCLGQVTRRLDVAVADRDGAVWLGTEIFEGPGKPVAGDVRDYQCWYRDPTLSPCGSGSNFSQALRADWE